MLSNHEIQNNWPTIKSQVLSKWSKLSEQEVENSHGNNSVLSKLVFSKYGNNEDFESAFTKICNSSLSKSQKNVPDFENRSNTAPSAEAGMRDDTFHSGSPERRANSNFAKVESTNEDPNHRVDEELSQYDAHSRTSETNNTKNNNSNKHFSAPDDFKISQDPSFNGEDVTLGRKISSATKISTAKAASSSSVASKDAKKKI